MSLHKTPQQIAEEFEVNLSLKDINGRLLRNKDTVVKEVDGKIVYARLFIQRGFFGLHNYILIPESSIDKIRTDSYCGCQAIVTTEELSEWEWSLRLKREGE